MRVYTCFKFKSHSPKELHCTHKFLGEQNEENLKKIISIIDEYFDNKNIESFSPEFIIEDFFGPNNEIRVLKAEPLSFNFLLDLKDSLDLFKEENHKFYTPHVSSSTHTKVKIPFYSYALVKDGKLYKEWKLASYFEPKKSI